MWLTTEAAEITCPLVLITKIQRALSSQYLMLLWNVSKSIVKFIYLLYACPIFPAQWGPKETYIVLPSHCTLTTAL